LSSSKKLRRSSAPNEIPDVAVIAASRDSAAANHRYGSPDVPGAAVVVVVVLVVVVVVAGDAAACAGTTMASTTGRVQVFGNNATVAPAPRLAPIAFKSGRRSISSDMRSSPQKIPLTSYTRGAGAVNLKAVRWSG
jgi:uncharacterized membrane protein YgcG